MFTLRRLFWLVLVASLVGCSRGTPEQVPIGQLANLSGPDRVTGERARQGLTLAVEEFNEDDPHSTGRRLLVEHADTRGEPGRAQAEAVRLITINRVAALVADIDPAELERLARGVQSYAVPVVVSSELPPRLPGENLFSLAASPASQGRALAQFAATDLKSKQVVILTNRTPPVSGALSAAFAGEFRQTKGAQVEDWPYGKESEFPDLIQRLEKAQPGAILLAGSVRDLSSFRKQLHGSKLTAPLLFGGVEGGWPPSGEDSSAGPAVYVSTVFAVEGLTSAGQEVARKYRKRFDQDLDVHAAVAYDSIRLLAEAMRRTKTAQGTRWREELLRLDDFESLTGPLKFDREDHNARRPVLIVRREGNQVKLARKFDPETK
jgi:branched-chain amino acid transport system substrate-binding protein